MHLDLRGSKCARFARKRATTELTRRDTNATHIRQPRGDAVAGIAGVRAKIIKKLL